MTTKTYAEKPVESWNVRDFHAYMQAEHQRLYGVSYAPFRSWRVEQGLLGNIVGTAKKQGSHGKALIKAFIDACFADYKPTADWPGISFGFMWTYMQRNLQKVERSKAEVSAKTTEATYKAEEVDEGWF